MRHRETEIDRETQRETERDRERQRETERDRERQRARRGRCETAAAADFTGTRGTSASAPPKTVRGGRSCCATA